MNGYICFYRGKRTEVYAESTYQAQKKAAASFKAKKTFEVSVTLGEKDGQQVTHSTTSLQPFLPTARLLAVAPIPA